MAGQSNARAGRLSIGELDLDAAWDALAGEATRDEEHAASLLAPDTVPSEASPRELEPGSIFGDGHSEAEAQLYAHLDRAREPQRTGFAPLDTLSARLNEFAPLPPRYVAAPDEVSHIDRAPSSQLDWFEGKFGELRQLITHNAADKSEIVSINTRLAEIIDRVDRLSAALPNEKAFASVEKQLSDFSKSLEHTRNQGASDADRISRAAKEILAAADSMEQTRSGFEATAKDTVQELRQTVITTAPLTIGQLMSAREPKKPDPGLARLEQEFQALNTHSRESSERAAAALDRVHNTLREFLERGPSTVSAPAPAAAPASMAKKRSGVQVPIAANAPEYSRSSAFGGAPAKKPALDTITHRVTPAPSFAGRPREEAQTKPVPRPDPRSAYERKGKSATPSPAPEGLQHKSHLMSAFPEDERNAALRPIIAVAITLLLASAMLYYLRLQGHLQTSTVSISAPQNRESPAFRATLRAGEPSAQPSATRIAGARTASQPGLPALLSAAEPGRAGSVPQALDEDVQRLTNAASRGDREAQFRIGARFLNNPVRSDASAAARWLTRAAEQGHVESQFLLASLFEKGAGVPKEERRALDLYRKAAQAGHTRAMHNLAVLLSSHDATQDYSEAASWFIRAATVGLADSQYNLALLYERGLGVPQNERKAYFWYSVAARAGDKDAKLQAERLKHGILTADADAISDEADHWNPAVEGNSNFQSGQNTRG